MTKIYLCKSNQCDPVLVSAVRRFIEKMDNVQLIEHKGGAYNPGLIKSADKVFVVPRDEMTNQEHFIIGKGQLEEIQNNLDKATIFLSKNYEFKGHAEIAKIEVFDLNSWQNSARVYPDYKTGKTEVEGEQDSILHS